MESIHSAAVGVSTWNGDETAYAGSLYNYTGADLFVNSFNVNPTIGDWSGFTLQAGSGLQAALGTAISAGNGIDGGGLDGGLVNIGWNNGAGGLQAGHYEGLVNFFGGADAGASDTLASENIAFDVIADPTFGGATEAFVNPDLSTTPGGASTFQMTITAGSLPFWAWPVSYGTGDTPLADSTFNFVDWPGLHGTLNPGDSSTFDAFSWTAAADTPAGTYHGLYGHMGGEYEGDFNQVFADNYTWTVNPVPEPVSMLTLGIGLAAIAARRKKA